MRLTVLYDGECSFCTRSARRAAAWSPYIELLPLQDPAFRRRYPHISIQDALESMHVVRADGLTERGARAWRLLAQLGPWYMQVAAALFVVPGVPWVAERIYRWIAARRYRDGGEHRDCFTDACFTDPGRRAQEIRAPEGAGSGGEDLA